MTKVTVISISIYFYFASIDARQYEFHFGNSDFVDHLTKNMEENDLFYLLMGDTQFWHPCTPENIGCLRATGFCSPSLDECRTKQGNHSNSLQEQSLRSLISQMAAKQMRPKGLIINGDLTTYGHREELKEFKKFWIPQLQGIPVYPGLGNHDYENNVDDCTANHCANRMLEFFKDFVRQRLFRPIDLKMRQSFMAVNYTGSLAYSWDQCVGPGVDTRLNLGLQGRCVRFVQLNNYPTYNAQVKGLVAQWNIQSSLEFLRQKLNEDKELPVIINFHKYDYSFPANEKSQFHRIITDTKFKVLAVFFAHVHPNIGLLGRLCSGGRPIPLIYTGSVPANNYLLIRVNPTNLERIKSVYKLHVNSEQETTVQEVIMPNYC